MKVLITGGYGFIGSHVAESLYKGGHKIYIIDNLSTGKIKNVGVPHKFYSLDINSERCEQIFKTCGFDVVINLAVQVQESSLQELFLDSKANILGITNMLNLSQKYGVKKFIFASSAAVYGNTEISTINEDTEVYPISPYGTSKLVSEFYCKKWFEFYGLKTICFRISNVFGPRQSINGETSVVAKFIDKVIREEDLTIEGDGNQTRDFIYVKDVAEVMFRALEKDYTGVLNLSTGIKNSINDLVNILKGFYPINNIKYKENSSEHIINSELSNEKLKEIFDWEPKYSFKEGLEESYQWYEEAYVSGNIEIYKKNREPREDFKTGFLRVLPFIENLVGLLIVMVLVSSNFLGSYSILTSAVDLCYIYILAMTVRHGMKQALISVIFSSSIYLYTLVSSGDSLNVIIYDPNHLLHLCIYVIIGGLVGYAVDINKTKLYINKLEIENMREKYKILEHVFEDTKSNTQL